MKARPGHTYRAARRNTFHQRGGTMPRDKVSKASVDYSPGRHNSRCGLCTYYYQGTCELVAGHIDPDYWCRLFKMRESDAEVPRDHTV